MAWIGSAPPFPWSGWAGRSGSSWQEGGAFVGALIGVGLIALAPLAVARAAKRQERVTLLDPELFRSKMFRYGSGQTLQQIALGGMMIALPIFLQMVLEYSAMLTGLSIAPLSLTMFAIALLAGKRRRATAEHLIMAGFAALAVGSPR